MQKKNNIIKKGNTLYEATSGNTEFPFQCLGWKRLQNGIIMPSNMSEERKIFKYYGAELIEIERQDFDGAIELRDKLCWDGLIVTSSTIS